MRRPASFTIITRRMSPRSVEVGSSSSLLQPRNMWTPALVYSSPSRSKADREMSSAAVKRNS
jgi:hypothetical protein